MGGLLPLPFSHSTLKSILLGLVQARSTSKGCSSLEVFLISFASRIMVGRLEHKVLFENKFQVLSANISQSTIVTGAGG
jgi:hypothetical protein